MLASSIPAKFKKSWAWNAGVGYTHTIPDDSQVGVTPGAASIETGFPPLNFSPVSSGGVPPFGQDFNGILNEITASLVWAACGGQYAYDSTFSTAIGGYPAGAILARADNSGYWLSLVDNNTANPETDATGKWFAINNSGYTAVSVAATNVTLTALQGAKDTIYISGALTANVQITVPGAAGRKWLVVNATSGAFTLTMVSSTGGSAITLTQGSSQIVWSDGNGYLNLSTFGMTQTQADARYLQIANLPVGRGGFIGLSASASGLDGNITASATQAVLTKANGESVLKTGISFSAVTPTLDTGTLTASNWYYLYFTWDGTTLRLQASLSSTAPSFAAGVYWARFGEAYNDASNHWYAFTQREKKIQYKISSSGNMTALLAIATGSTSSVLTPSSISNVFPPTASKIQMIVRWGSTGGVFTAVAPNANYSVSLGSTNACPWIFANSNGSASTNCQAPIEMVPESTTNVYWASNSAGTGLYALGWETSI